MDFATLVDAEGQKYLQAEFRTRNFKEAVHTLTKVCEMAEDMNHHPDVSISNYKTVRLTIFTHKDRARELSQADMDLAEMLVSKVGPFVKYEKRWLKEQGEAKEV